MTNTARKQKIFRDSLEIVDSLEGYYIDHIKEAITEMMFDMGMVSDNGTDEEFSDICDNIFNRLTKTLYKGND
jgi:hypothetical protein